jgi:toxin ParE1/3/4
MADPDCRLIWSTEALADLSEIWDYYANVAGRQTADGVIRDVEKVCRVLEEHPLTGRARDELRPGLRSIAARPYIVFHRVRNGFCEIVRVLHGRRDLDRIFVDDTSD